MYTSYIGKKFLEYYKEEYNKPKDYSAEQFFEEIMFPLFFNDERHLMNVINSPFFQSPGRENIAKYGSKTQAQYHNFKNKVKEGVYASEILVGSGSSDITSYYSGQISNIPLKYTAEDIYLSWIGQALAIIVKGGIAILFEEKELLLTIQKGWQFYSEFLKQTPGLKDKQIETWNGNYLTLALNNNDFVDFQQIKFDKSDSNISIQTINWTKVVFELAKFYKQKDLLIYAYLLSKSNNTFGNFILKLHEIYNMFEFRDKYFINQKDTILSDAEISKLEPYYTFRKACQMGSIGLKSIEPIGLRKYVFNNNIPFATNKKIDIENDVNYSIYKLWIIAMINKKELIELSKQFASVLLDTINQLNKLERSKTTYNQYLKELFESSSPKTFIQKLNGILNKQNADLLTEIVEQVVLMPKDNFPLFITLLKFEYYALQLKQEN